MTFYMAPYPILKKVQRFAANGQCFAQRCRSLGINWQKIIIPATQYIWQGHPYACFIVGPKPLFATFYREKKFVYTEKH